MFDIAHVKPPKVNVLVDGTELAGWGGGTLLGMTLSWS